MYNAVAQYSFMKLGSAYNRQMKEHTVRCKQLGAAAPNSCLLSRHRGALWCSPAVAPVRQPSQHGQACAALVLLCCRCDRLAEP